MTTETNLEATARISQELRAEKKLKERRDVVMNCFFELTGIPMNEKQFNKYNSLFNKAKDGYNIKSFIRDEKIVVDKKVLDSNVKDFVDDINNVDVNDVNKRLLESKNKS